MNDINRKGRKDIITKQYNQYSRFTKSSSQCNAPKPAEIKNTIKNISKKEGE